MLHFITVPGKVRGFLLCYSFHNVLRFCRMAIVENSFAILNRRRRVIYSCFLASSSCYCLLGRTCWGILYASEIVSLYFESDFCSVPRVCHICLVACLESWINDSLDEVEPCCFLIFLKKFCFLQVGKAFVLELDPVVHRNGRAVFLYDAKMCIVLK